MSHVTKYFKLSFSDARPEPLVCDVYDIKTVDRYFHVQGEPVSDWPVGVTLYYMFGRPEDYIVNALGWPIVSERVQGVILQLGGAHVQFLPIEIVQKESGIRLPGYSVLNTLAILPALDRDHAVCREVPETPAQPIVIKPALVETRVSAFHVFRIQEQRSLLFVSEALKGKLERIGTTGMKFRSVPAY